MKFATSCLAAVCTLAIIGLTPATVSAARWQGRGWVGPGVYHVGPRWRYAYGYPHHNPHWHTLQFSSAPWRYRGRDDHRWDEE